jgi:hypothetical protein
MRWFLNSHRGRQRVELPDPPTHEAVAEVLERVALRPGLAREVVFTALPSWIAPKTIRCDTLSGMPLATFRRSQARAASR